MNNQWIRIFSISGAYIALLIGGAFSTGQEAMQFFVGFGSKGLIGLLICSFLIPGNLLVSPLYHPLSATPVLHGDKTPW